MAIPKVTPTQAELDSTKPGGKHRADLHAQKHKDRHGSTTANTTKKQAPQAQEAPSPGRRRARRPPRSPRSRRPANSARPAPTPAPSASPRRPGCSTRAGFGPAPAKRTPTSRMGLVGAVQSLTRPSSARAAARARAGRRGRGPGDRPRGHLGPRPPLVAGPDDPHEDSRWSSGWPLIRHGWFATSEGGVSKQQQMIEPVEPLPRLRASAPSSNSSAWSRSTRRCSQWLNNDENVKGAPNKNSAREMMELFSLGADRGAYTEDDIREQCAGADRLDLRMVL